MGKLSTESLGDEGGGKVEDEDLEISSMEGHIQETSRQFISPFPPPKPSCWVLGLSRYRGSGNNSRHEGSWQR